MIDSMELARGVVISERYQLDHELGSGGMGSVWAARHLVTGKNVALKFLSANKPEARQRFIREARAASRVRHPNVVAVHDVLELDDGGLVMVMDLLFGETLGQRLDRRGSLSVRETASILAPVISAVGSAHAAGVVHRDLKPDNIFLADDEPTPLTASGQRSPEVRVLDFGIAKLHEDFESAGLTNTGALLGTPYYMSPEQIFGEKDIDARADVWSLGVIIYECLTGRRPFEGDNAGQVMKAILKGEPVPIDTRVPDLPPPMIALVQRMMELDRDERPRDLQEPLDVLSAFAAQPAPPFAAPRSSLPPLSLRTADGSDPYADTTDHARLDTLPSAQQVVSRPRPMMLDTADGMATSTFYERRGGWLVATIAIGTITIGLAVGGWLLMRGPSEPAATPAPSETAAAASEPKAPPATAEPTPEPEASAPAAPSMPAPPRRATRPPKPTPSSKPVTVQTSLPFGVEGKVPF
jgi:serine/threonine-protein kinase